MTVLSHCDRGALQRVLGGEGGRNVGGPVFNQRGTLKNDKNDI